MMRKLAAFAATLTAMATLVVVSASPASAKPETCFGYTGDFMLPTTPYVTFKLVPWDPGADNCFGITSDRRIWVTAAGHPWSVIPGGGRADGFSNFFEAVGPSRYGKIVQVYVKASGNYYCQTWWSDTNWEGHWTLCN